MKKRWTGYAAAALTASIALGGTANAATLTLAGIGADLEVKEKTAVQTEAPAVTQTEAAESQTEAPAQAQTEAPAQTQTEAAPAEEAPQTEAQTEAPVDRSMVDTTGFAKADDYVNVRASGDTEGEVVGTLRLNDSVYIEDVDENGWYRIRSGNVEGYVAGYLIATGEEAEEVAKNTAYTYAQIGADYLNIRSDATEDAEVLDTVGQDANLEVVEDLGDWVKVVTDDGIYGYVSRDYVDTQTVYPTGETVQEQSEREEQEYLEAVAQQEAEYAEYLAQQEAEAAAYAEAAAADSQAAGTASADTSTYTDTTYTETAAVDTSAQTVQTASASDVDALYQAYLTAQENAMTATDEADATAKANAAIEAYNAYLAACGSTQTVAAAETAAAATTDTTAATDAGSAQAVQAQASQTEAPQTEAPQTEAAASTSSGSGLGSQIASYATQFVGNPYVYGGSSLTGGADCSGFTMAVYSNFGIGLPHNAAAQSGCGTQVSLSDLQPGDLLFYGDGGIGHVALYIGGGSVVHASNPETGIKISSYNYRNPVSAVRLV